MPSPISITVHCAPHLVRFMVAVYGPQPLQFPRKDNFSMLLNYLLEKESDAETTVDPHDEKLEIQLPYFENKNVLYNYVLTPMKESIFINKIDERFRLSFNDEMNRATLVGISKIDSVHLFMDSYNMPEDCIDMLLKSYQRYIKLKRYHRLSQKNKKISSVKGEYCPAVSPC
ncbi:MAG: hypothetical protein ACOYN4_05275 [Bacteroidales bacterium]